MRLTVIASSSKGNCYVLDTGKEILLLECGVRFPDIQKALSFDFSRVIGCLVTHEHQDHAKAVQDVMKAGIDLFCSSGTAGVLGLSGHRMNLITPLKQFQVGNFLVLPFQTEHDAEDPVGYLIYHQGSGEKLLFATDTYYVRNRFSGVNYFLVECNYCRDVLQANVDAGVVPEALKSRLVQSHFGLHNVKDFLKANVTTDTRKIVLIHLSDDNSDAARMQREVEELTGIETVVAESGLEIELELYPF